MTDFDSDDELSFSDEELSQAMSSWESDAHDDASASDDASSHDDEVDASLIESIDQLDPTVNFADELAGLTGEKAKSAVIITRVASAELLAAFCQLSDIAATCVEDRTGSVAVLKNLDGNNPEAAVKDMTNVVSGMMAILAVNRANKLTATAYMRGASVRDFPPPVVLDASPSFAEDLLLGLTTLDELQSSGHTVVDAATLDHEAAVAVISKHTRYGRGGSIPGASVK